MSTIQQQLRPYYDHDTFNAGYCVTYKPGIGLIDSETNRPLTSTILNLGATNSTGKVVGRVLNDGTGMGIYGDRMKSASSMTGDKNYIYDLELLEYFDMNNLSELFKNLVWNFCKNYCKVLVSQPLEIVRLVLQVGTFEFQKKKSDPPRRLYDVTTGVVTDVSEVEDSDYEIDYFQTPNKPPLVLPVQTRTKKSKKKKQHKLQPVSIHLLDIMTAIVAKDGPFALFRGINASFIHQTLSHTIEAWITGFISPFLGIPDPFFLELTHSNDPFKSLWLLVTACVLTGLVLIPLDLIQVRLMLTQFNTPQGEVEEVEDIKDSNDDLLTEATEEDTNKPIMVNTRSVRESIRNYPFQTLIQPPLGISILTILHQFSIVIFRKTAPYVMFIKFNIDSYSSPTIYTMVNLMALIMELFIKLPLENLLRKEQVRFLLTPKASDPKKVITIDNPNENLIVNFNGLAAIESKLEDVQEGTSSEIVVRTRVPNTMFTRISNLGLFNGWRVGVLNVIGFWGYNILKSNGTELREERL